MPDANRMSGVLSPVVTPFRADLSPDANRLIGHCRWLLGQNCGLAVFGTNSEANSLTVPEKLDLLEQLVDSGIDPKRMMPGTGCCAIPDTVELTKKAVELGCAGVLMLPPFYYKGVPDDGLYNAYAEIIDRVGSPDLRIYLYHIPPVANVPLSLDLIDRLVSDFPQQIAGVKDSGGDWANTEAMLKAGWEDFRVFVGSESFLLANMRNGGAGCISATANVNPAAIEHLYANWQGDDADQLQSDLDDIRDIFVSYVAIPSLKAAISHFGEDPEWGPVRPPLLALDEEAKTGLIADLETAGFTMPGLAEARAAAE